MKYHPEHKLLKDILQKDHPGISPDKATEERLNYHFMLKHSTGKVHSNSFGGAFLWLFSLKSLALKTSLLSVCLGYFLFFGNLKNSPSRQELADTSRVHQTVIDSNYVLRDTCK